MFTRRVLFVGCLFLSGCIQPGNYNLNVGVGPLDAGGASPKTGTTATAPDSATGGSASTAPAKPAASPGATSAAGRIDQAQESVATFQQLGDGTRLAQTFTVKAAGKLAAVGVRLKTSSPTSSDAALVLRGVDAAGHPADPLGSATIHGTALGPDGGSWSIATLDAPVTLAAAGHYAFELTFTGPHPIYAGAAPAATYPDGAGFTGLTDGSTFWNKIGESLAFRTYMQ